MDLAETSDCQWRPNMLISRIQTYLPIVSRKVIGETYRRTITF
jgi:hypothetical protein